KETRMAIYSKFCEKQRSVLFSTDVAARGLDLYKAVDWVVQVDCPENIASYIHRTGRTARYKYNGNSVLFLLPSETRMLDNLIAANVPVQLAKPRKELLQPVSSLLASLLANYPKLQSRARWAFVTYMRSIHLQKDKQIFDVEKLPIGAYLTSLGLAMTPDISFLKQIITGKAVSIRVEPEDPNKENVVEGSTEKLDTVVFKDEETENDLLHAADTSNEGNVKSVS
ncbi:DEAD-box ATP-dependent RNA helicase 32-like, partial [Trifolium medium]|nr:DEAD-box ATP-dependent RNA helicase 32-like [Trifolium medium]